MNTYKQNYFSNRIDTNAHMYKRFAMNKLNAYIAKRFVGDNYPDSWEYFKDIYAHRMCKIIKKYFLNYDIPIEEYNKQLKLGKWNLNLIFNDEVFKY